MAIAFGSKERFAVEIGEFCDEYRQIRRVDLWAGGRWLTCDDNHAYLPQFCGDVRGTLTCLQLGYELSAPFPGHSLAENHLKVIDSGDDRLNEPSKLLYWGPTTDSVVARFFRIGDRLAITFRFPRECDDPAERGEVFVTELPESEFIEVLERMLAVLEA